MSDIVANRSKYVEGWTGGLPETPCGYGAKIEATARQRDWLPRVFKRHDIKSIADIGAGDLNWISSVDLTGIDYQAYDLVPRHPSVIEFDIVRQVPPAVDAILCLWVLNHLPFDDCRQALKNIRASGSKYLIMTDRPKWHDEQPPEIKMQALDALLLNDKGDRIKVIKL